MHWLRGVWPDTETSLSVQEAVLSTGPALTGDDLEFKKIKKSLVLGKVLFLRKEKVK